ncbi:hypothetical protein [Azorhizobium doebereinerae]|uniref:hypothetical protein n=1 Tax=Azorhizobium doebereinerae TaxID=281091 RepID=UPI0003FA9996|nr:hypothetical protein [Azorhizobium doebereinerae]
MTANETTLSRLLGTLGAMLRAAVPVQSPALAGAPAVALTETQGTRASFGGRKDDEDEREPAWASFPRAL